METSGGRRKGASGTARSRKARSFLEQLPNGPMKDALRGQDASFAEQEAKAYLDADDATRADIAAFFESDGPRKVHEAKLRVKDGTPMTGELEQWFTTGGRRAGRPPSRRRPSR